MRETKELTDALKHLRLHFSFLLMPVYLFALSQSTDVVINDMLLVFIVLHFFVYPASNAFNSYHDKDTSSIGGLKNPPPINENVRLLANLMDFLALTISGIFLPLKFTIMVAVYIAMSRLYSHKKIRLKQHAIFGFLTVFIFQGGFTYMMVLMGLGQVAETNTLFAVLAVSFQIGAAYPLTQIYQHVADKADGVNSLSRLVGYCGTFIFSGISFGLALMFYFLYLKSQNEVPHFYILLIFQIPVVAFFNMWAFRVLKNKSMANYVNTMRMSVISAVCMNLCFMTLYFMNNCN